MKQQNPRLWHGFTVDPDNIPLSRPGVYKITHIESGMSYVGASTNLANRCFDHARGGSNVVGLQEILAAHSGKGSKNRRHAFLLTPLFYTLDPKATRKGIVTEVEDAMIEVYDSINHGWNLPRPNVADLCKSPAAIEKRRVTEASPETKARRSAEMNRRWNDINYSNRVVESIRRADADPERNNKISASKSGKRWITNGELSTTIDPRLTVPEGWWYGKCR